ncbi:MAG: DUF924 family protein [Beijerinckiaceae bacterium]
MAYPRADEIVTFWRAAGPGRWFAKDVAFDDAIHVRFQGAHLQAARRELASWMDTPLGAYALMLLLDQFPRNIYRNSGHAFATDGLALAYAEEAIRRGHDQAFANPERRFFYTPHMHAEDLAMQERCIALCRAANDDEGVKYAIIHRDIIARFGRFPHRNPALGRVTTAEEQAFLDTGGFAG